MGTTGPFEKFVAEHPVYAQMYSRLNEESRKLALSAAVVHSLHASELAGVAVPILEYVQHRYGPDAAARYAARIRRLAELQAGFDRDPRLENLGAPGELVDREVYDLSLLLSIAFTNHRFEIMQCLGGFLAGLPAGGVLAIVGAGTGYELKLAAQCLTPAWEIESYDKDPRAEEEARRLLAFFAVRREIRFGREFPLDTTDRSRLGRYDAIVACEILEHLPDPAGWLKVMREHLAQTGRMFVTMAVNIAQEDHVFLYSDLQACRAQLRDCGLRIVEEWITPQIALPPPPDREAGFRRGNFIATVEKE